MSEAYKNTGEEQSVELTSKQNEVLGYLAEGITREEIREKLDISLTSLQDRISRLFTKLGVSRREGAVLRANELGLIALPELELPPIEQIKLLSDLEADIVKIYAAYGMEISVSQIASFVGVSSGRVKSCIRAVDTKLGCNDKLERIRISKAVEPILAEMLGTSTDSKIGNLALQEALMDDVDEEHASNPITLAQRRRIRLEIKAEEAKFDGSDNSWASALMSERALDRLLFSNTEKILSLFPAELLEHNGRVNMTAEIVEMLQERKVLAEDEEPNVTAATFALLTKSKNPYIQQIASNEFRTREVIEIIQEARNNILEQSRQVETRKAV